MIHGLMGFQLIHNKASQSTPLISGQWFSAWAKKQRGEVIFRGFCHGCKLFAGGVFMAQGYIFSDSLALLQLPAFLLLQGWGGGYPTSQMQKANGNETCGPRLRLTFLPELGSHTAALLWGLETSCIMSF